MKQLLALLLFVPSLCLGQVPDYVPLEGLVGWFPFDSSTVDQSVMGNNGLLIGGTYGNDRLNNPSGAVELDGEDDSIEIIPFNGVADGSSVSVSFWAYQQSPANTDQQMILSEYNGSGSEGNMLIWGYRAPEPNCPYGNCMGFDFFTGANDLRLYSETQPVTSWTHWVLVFDADSSAFAFYRNGELLDNKHPVNTWNGNFNLGVVLGAVDYVHLSRRAYFHGLLDDVGIWNTPLDSIQAWELYSSSPLIKGCTDQTACNYDASAQDDDGSCLYPPSGNLGDAIALCDDGGTLDAGPGFSSYAWSTGADTQMIDVFEEGEYSVSTTFGGAPPNVSSVELEGTGGALESAIQTTDSLADATWMGWFWFDDLDSPQGLLAQNNGYNTNGYYINTNPFFDTATSTGGSSNSAIWFSSPVGSTNQNAQSWTQADAILPMTWHHIAVVLENGLIQIHVDGIAATMHNSFNEDWLAPYDVDQHVVEVSDAPFRLGSGTDINGNVDQVMGGKMDEISLWNRALTLDEIQGYMNCPPSATSAGIQALWTFEDPSPLEDQSGQGHTTTLSSGQIVPEAPVATCPSCTTQDTVLVVHMDCEGLCGDGTVWDSSLGICVSACEPPQGQCGEGTVWDPVNEECIIAIPTDNDLDGCVSASDVLNLLSTFGTCPPVPEWPDAPTDTIWACGAPLTYWDYDYATVQIGDQCWFAENLRTTTYTDGTVIPASLTDGEWTSATSGATAVFGEGMSTCYGYSPDVDACDESQSLSEFGRLYNWFAVDDARGLCPTGWDVPTDGEWTQLEDYITSEGFSGTEGIALKSATGWHNNGIGTDNFGFSALPGGTRLYDFGYFYWAGGDGVWWSRSPHGGNAWYRYLVYYESSIGRASNDPRWGFNVRCIKD